MVKFIYMDKKREKIHIEHFKEICSFFPDGEIECTERPDFIVHTKDKLLGIDHTEIFQPEPSSGGSLQALDQMSKRVVKQACDLYLQNHNPPLFVQITFRRRIFIEKQKVDHLAEILSRLIERTQIIPGTLITIKRTRENSEYFPIEITTIRLYSHPDGKENLWICFSEGSIPEITADYLQGWIIKKEEKVEDYRSKCSEVWLLIVADYSRIPTTLDISDDAAAHCYRTNFDRVFFFWHSISQYIELQLTN